MVYLIVTFIGFKASQFLSIFDDLKRNSTVLKLASQSLQLLNKGHRKFLHNSVLTLHVSKPFEWVMIKYEILKLHRMGLPLMCSMIFLT